MKQFVICLGVDVILLLNVMVMFSVVRVFSVVGGDLLDIPFMVLQRMCVL